jgi:ACS family tartrate transporter-like MFS transporter
MVLVSRSSDRSGERFLHVAIPTAIGAVGFIAVGLLLAEPMAAMFALAVAAAGDYSTRGPFWALPGKFLSGGALASAIAIINAMGAVGGAIGPTTVGYLKDRTGSFLGPMMLLSGVLLIGSVLTLFLRRSPTLKD